MLKYIKTSLISLLLVPSAKGDGMEIDMRRIVSVFLVVLCLLTFVGCTKTKVVEASGTVSRDVKFNSATVSLSPEEFEKAGFSLGDSCDIVFENGYSIADVPFYNGYYVKNNAPVIVAYPGFSNIIITYNNRGIWDDAELTENDTVTIRLKEANKYSSVQEALGQVYSFEYSDYDGTEEFCNFRALSGGELKEDFLFRGASPVDNSRNRAAYTDQLLKERSISYVIDLADSEENMQGYLSEEDYSSPYTAGLYENGQIALLDMSSSYQSEEYQQKVAIGMKAMLHASGPVYIHCLEGKDRTGFVCLLLEALSGASYEEMRDDYMKTYENYYAVSSTETPEKYDAIVKLYFDPFVSYLHGTDHIEELKNADYVQDAMHYLITGGMTRVEVDQLREFITE